MNYKIASTKLAKLALAGIAVGALSLSACKDSTSSNNTDDKTGETALAKFIADCEASGGTASSHECEGMNECAGQSFQLGIGIKSHDCKGMSECKGSSCVVG